MTNVSMNCKVDLVLHLQLDGPPHFTLSLSQSRLNDLWDGGIVYLGIHLHHHLCEKCSKMCIALCHAGCSLLSGLLLVNLDDLEDVGGNSKTDGAKLGVSVVDCLCKQLAALPQCVGGNSL